MPLGPAALDPKADAKFCGPHPTCLSAVAGELWTWAEDLAACPTSATD